MKFDVIQSMWSSRTLRISYQQEAVDGLNSYADVQKPGSLQSGLLVMPTGERVIIVTGCINALVSRVSGTLIKNNSCIA